MPNPALLLCDSDVLVQLFIVDDLRALKELRDGYGVQPTVVLEVEVELRWIKKYKDRFVPQLDKALRSGVLNVLDQTLFQSFLGNATPGTSWASFQALGAQYDGYVQRGEAYTFAAAVTLGFPALSNDFSAIQTLEAQMLALPVTVLRAFDLLSFAYGVGCMTSKECDLIRKRLLKDSEHVPLAFENASFESGLPSFLPRLLDGSGTVKSSGSRSYNTPLVISRI